MRYIIMADGKGTRWDNYNNIPKHFLKVEGETLLQRTVRLLNQEDSEAEVIITSHDSRYEVEGATRYEPRNNHLEIDRFTEELIENDVCFMYGDTYYTEEAMKLIVNTEASELLFFGTAQVIVAIKVADGECFRYHTERVRQLYKEGRIDKCIGWQVYQSYEGLPYDHKVIKKDYIKVGESTCDFNTPEDIKKLESK
ncbi:MAG: hypothetical protein RR364_04030 [Lachnospiraceae bacterium]